jgi:hypothetical protein
MPVFAEIANTENRLPKGLPRGYMAIFTHTLSRRLII